MGPDGVKNTALAATEELFGQILPFSVRPLPRRVAWDEDAEARPTTTNLVRILGPGGWHAHDAYHPWDPLELWADDTHLPKTRPKVEGAGKFRDPIRSTRRHVVYLHGLNIVLCLRLRLPALRQPVAVPINVRIDRKGGPSHLDLLADMARQVIDSLPDRHFLLWVAP